jgi:DNA-binding SARP family transcriptional activator
MIELATLGGSSIRRDGSEFTGLSAHKQKIALLSYLAVEGPVARDSLVVLFWPERDQEKASHSLSQALYALKKDLGEDVVGVAGDRVGLLSESVAIDVKQLEAAGQEERWEDVVALYEGPFLDKFFLANTPAFDEWQTRTRAWVGSLARKAFGKVIASRAAAGDVAGALEVAWRWARLEPLEDEAQHALIALLAMSGDRSAALDQYDAFRARLTRELEVEPLEGTAALVEGIRTGVLPRSPLLGEEPAAESPVSPAPPPVPEAGPSFERAGPVTDDVEQLLKDELGPRLEIISKLAESSTANVYLAREHTPHPQFTRLVAVKVFSPTLAPNQRARQRFEREVQAVGSLVHSNIVALHWAGALSSGVPYFVMEYVEGRSLAEKLKAEGRMEVSEARRVLAAVAWALAAAHRRGIVHRDVEPANVLCHEETGRCLLADFGIAKILARVEDRPFALTDSTELVGNPAWMSPERVKAEEVSGPSDVYNLGLLGYALLAGEGPYVAATRQEMYAAHVNQKPRKLSKLRPDVDPDLEDLFLHCLAKDPRHRPSAAHVAQRLTSPQPGSSGPGPVGWFQRLLARRVPHFVGVYLAAGFGLFELIDIAVGRPALPRHAMPLYLATYLLGIPVVSIVTWFHGKRGPQRVQKLECVLLATILLIWLAVSAAILLLL